MKPVVAANSPIAVDVEKGREYFWCRCGRSGNQPFCDGSHQGTDFTPLPFTPTEDGQVWLCRCKQTRDAPYCDGTHNQVADEVVGTEFAVSDDGHFHEDTSAPTAVATAEEPTVELIHHLARHGTAATGPYGEMVAMGVPRAELPDWDDIQFLTAQLDRKPLPDDAPVGTDLVIGPQARRPLRLEIPLLVSDMSFGALSQEAKIALAAGAELAGTAICSGEGGMLPEEHQANSRYLLEYASAKFGYNDSLLPLVQAFHYKCGQAAKTGTGGHLPGSKVTGRVAEVRGLPEGQTVDSPPTFTDLHSVDDFVDHARRVRELTGGIPVGFKMSAQHIEADVEFAVRAGADYIILDGRGGGTGDAPRLFRDHISVPTIPALRRARHTLDALGASGSVTLIITGGLRTPADYAKALALGADGVALATSAMQAIGCVAARICNTNRCPSGVATQDPALRARLDGTVAPTRLGTFLRSSVELMQVMARACGHGTLHDFDRHDLTSWKKDMADLAGIQWAGFVEDRGQLA